MADWTINTDSNPSHGRTRFGAATPAIQYFQASTAASTAVIKLGDIVSRDTTVSTGGFRIRRAYAGGGNGSNLLAIGQTIVGIAVEADTSSGTSTPIDGSSAAPGAARDRLIGVAVAEPGCEFLMFQTNGVSRSSNNGDDFSVRYDSTNHVFLVDSTNSTAALVTVTQTGVPSQYEGDTNGPVYVKFLSSNVFAGVK
jgi:hypothetical protein